MKNKRTLNVATALLSLATLVSQSSMARAQNAVVTYQGRVTSAGTSFTGTGQFKFALVTSTNSAATATAVATVSGGFVTIVNLASGGSGYATTPTVTFLGGGGSGAVATATLSGGMVTAITVNNPGSGYTTPPTVILSAPPPVITYLASHWSNDGTSSAGSEPATGVTIPISGGLFSVGLGDTTVPGMAALDAALFQQPNLQLRLWFNDGVHGFAALDPAQKLTTAPYAAHASTAGGLAGVNNQPVSLSVNGIPALRLEDNGDSSDDQDSFPDGAPNVIGGSPANTVAPGVVGATIGGGGATNFNGISYTNRAAADFSTVAGGVGNVSSGRYSTVGGGALNLSSGIEATVGGGHGNVSSGSTATIGGGYYNVSSGGSATVPGGAFNEALGFASFAAGNAAKAVHDRSFVWSSYLATSPSFAANTFFVNAPDGLGVNCGAQRGDGGGEYWLNFGRIAAGGQMIETSVGASLSLGGAWQNASDLNRKADFSEVDSRAVLEKLATLPVRQWRYTNEASGVKHLGPTAQDFKGAFGLGEQDTSIATVDADGVALAAIQGLNLKLEASQRENSALQERVEKLEKLLQKLVNE